MGLKRSLALLLSAMSLVCLAATPAFAQPGSLDPGFDGDGKVLTTLGAGDAAAAGVVVQTDGRIVAAGYASNGVNDDFALVRYSPDGSLDPSFGIGGVTLTDFGGADRATSLTLLPDGRIVAAGFADMDFGVACYLPNGSLDASFGSNGIVRTGLGGPASAEAVAVQADGKIVAAGWVTSHRQSDIALTRYTPSGTPDLTFRRTGRVILDLGSNEYAAAIALQPNGRILVAGASGDDGTQFALARFRKAGVLDTTFGDGTGAVITSFALPTSWSNAVALEANGRITVAGFAYEATHYRFALARYLSSGQLDTTFGRNGKVLTHLGPGNETAQSLALQPGGAIVVGGSLGEDFALARYTSAGALDPSFGSGGYVTTDFGSLDQAQAELIQPDGKILLAGFSGDDTRLSFAVARYVGA